MKILARAVAKNRAAKTAIDGTAKRTHRPCKSIFSGGCNRRKGLVAQMDRVASTEGAQMQVQFLPSHSNDQFSGRGAGLRSLKR